MVEDIFSSQGYEEKLQDILENLETQNRQQTQTY